MLGTGFDPLLEQVIDQAAEVSASLIEQGFFDGDKHRFFDVSRCLDKFRVAALAAFGTARLSLIGWLLS
jgi:hypothetical protein